VRHVISILLLLLALGRPVEGHGCLTTEPERIGLW
jgi:hypothetical protein